MKLRYSYFLIFLFFPNVTANKHSKFNTIQQISTYAKTRNEFPKIDNDSWVKPDYTSFYKSLEQNIFQRISCFLGLQNPPEWSSELYKTLLKKITETREVQQYGEKNIIKLTPKEKTKLIIWGDLQGAFHSLTRDLEELEKLGILTNELKITKPYYYFVFNGDLINRSPYSLETLTVALRLLEKNPQQIFYIRGNHEHEDHFDYGIKQELLHKAKNVSHKKIPLKNLLLRFFNTLPLALYITIPKSSPQEFIKIAALDKKEAPQLNEKLFSDFLKKETPKTITTYTLKKEAPKTNGIQLKAIIKAESRSTVFRVTDGLSLIPQEQAATTWTTLSSPIKSYNHFYNFYNDAFTILDVGPNPYNWPLTLYYQNIEKKEGFKNRSVDLFTGISVKNKQSFITSKKPEIILIGSSIDQSKIASELCKQIKNGIELRVNQINQEGGINGKILKVIFLDNEYSPNKTRQTIETLLKKYHTPFILNTFGTVPLESYLPLIEEGIVVNLFPYSGAGIFRKQELRNMIHYRASFAAETKALVEYAIKKLQKERFAIFYQNDAAGLSSLYGAQKTLNENNITHWLETSYSKNNLNVKESAEKIKAFNPEAILFFAVAPPSRALIREIGIENLANTTCLGISPLTENFQQFLQNHGLDLILGRVVPNPKQSTIPIVQAYRKEQEKRNETHLISANSLEGYVNTSILIEALKKIDGPITKESVLNQLESFKNYNLQGLNLTFNPKTRELNTKLWIDDGKGTWHPYNLTIDYYKESEFINNKNMKE